MSARQLTVVVVGSLAGLLLAGRCAVAQQGSAVPEVGYPIEFAVSPPLRDMPSQAHAPGRLREIPLHRPPGRPSPGNITDPVLQTSTPTPAAAQSLQQWEGVGAGYPGFTVTEVPPDTNMAVGPNHIVQWVNNGLVVFNKQGSQVKAPVDDASFWGFLQTCSQGGGFSDPIVQYDRAANRWLLSEVAIPFLLLPPYFQFAQCFAVSTTADPTGSYYGWAYGFGSDLNDYPKIGVWPDGYYVTWNMFGNGGATFSGARAAAFDRNAMLSGVKSPAVVRFQLSSAYASLLASDRDGATAPPAGSPNFFMNVDPSSGALNLWKFHVNFANPNSSTFTGPTSIAGIAPFTAPCLDNQGNTLPCVPQPGSAQLLDAIGDRLMYRLAYRNFGDHESLVANHTVVAGGSNTGVRWYEVRDPNGTPTLYQQGTFAPDTNYRWMASIATDQSGNIGVGYSISNGATDASAVYPSIGYTGWEVGNPLGTLQAETIMIAGGGTQDGYDRWGDYSAMRIDPNDDCTFWYTTEYQAVTTPSANWNTRIGSFKFPSCGQTQTQTPTTTALASSANPSTYGQSVTFTATVTSNSGSGTPTGTATFKDGSTMLGSSALNGGVATYSTSSLTGGSHSITAVYGGDANFSGSTSAALNQTVNQVGTSTALTSGLNPSNYGQSVTFTATVTPASASGTPAGTVTFYDGAAPLGSSALNASGIATFSISTLAAGDHSITATYGGDTNYTGSTSNPVSQTVAQNTTTTTLTSKPNPSFKGQAVTFTATVKPGSGTGTPTGTVTFKDGSTTLGSSGLNSSGVATFSTSSLSVGTHSITATYGGDTNYTGSTSAPLTQTVKQRNK